jgi:hypothetical protein
MENLELEKEISKSYYISLTDYLKHYEALKDKDAYLLWNPLRSAPTVVHLFQSLAVKEATRLLEYNEGPFLQLSIERVYTRPVSQLLEIKLRNCNLNLTDADLKELETLPKALLEQLMSPKAKEIVSRLNALL